ncbi:MAG: hypothetical protein PHU21_12185 [Elusimicrobia bacterium]|jgi:hypothetical protein|nr:hypothetical protein [Elusimicrobiota bacterium]
MKSLKGLGLLIVAGLVLAAGSAACKKEEAPAAPAAEAPAAALPDAATGQMNTPTPPAPAAQPAK